MSKAMERIMDAVDLETFIVCKDEEEGKKLSIQLMDELGFKDVNIVFCQHQGPGARVRLRGYVYKPGDRYGWLKN
ncbi:MAG: hypothetical protein NUV45_06610 [Tepidanaerobacteraceae bacterium]|nr:hypothetical protein [Tepidanaerobacteraceae bacterium]